MERRSSNIVTAGAEGEDPAGPELTCPARLGSQRRRGECGSVDLSSPCGPEAKRFQIAVFQRRWLRVATDGSLPMILPFRAGSALLVGVVW